MHPYRRIATLLALAALGSGAAQKPPPMLPELGAYGCTITTLVPGTRFNAFTGRIEPQSQLAFYPSALGTLTLGANSTYKLSAGEAGQYRYDAKTGQLTFTGYLASLRNSYAVTDGQFSITFVYKGKSGGTQDHYCTRSSKNARAALSKNPNPGLPGTITFNWAAALQTSTVREVEVASGKATTRFNGSQGQRARNGETAYLNPNGVIVVASANGATTARLEPETVQSPASGYSYDVRRDSVALSPDGSRIAYATWDVINKARVIVRARNGAAVAQHPGMMDPSWAPDGRLIMAGDEANGGTAGLYLTDASLKSLKRIDPKLDNPDTPAVSPDGKRVAFQYGRQVWVMNLDGSGLRKLPSTNDNFRQVKVYAWPTWSPDGKWIAVVADINDSDLRLELLVLPASGDPKLIQYIADPETDAVEVASARLSWR